MTQIICLQLHREETVTQKYNFSFLRGKKTTKAKTGESVYNLHDGFSVFDSSSNTPTYWKETMYEMRAKLDNLGLQYV